MLTWIAIFVAANYAPTFFKHLVNILRNNELTAIPVVYVFTYIRWIVPVFFE